MGKLQDLQQNVERLAAEPAQRDNELTSLKARVHSHQRVERAARDVKDFTPLECESIVTQEISSLQAAIEGLGLQSGELRASPASLPAPGQTGQRSAAGHLAGDDGAAGAELA